jgi:hypothetical protein
VYHLKIVIIVHCTDVYGVTMLRKRTTTFVLVYPMRRRIMERYTLAIIFVMLIDILHDASTKSTFYIAS